MVDSKTMEDCDQISIRVATHEDDHLIGDLLVRAFTIQNDRLAPQVRMSKARVADLRDLRSKRAAATVLVAEDETGIIGTVTLYPPQAPGNEGWVSDSVDLRCLAVRDDHFGKGVAKRLLAHAVEWAQHQNVSAICLHARTGALGLARMYEGFGFVRDPAGDVKIPNVVYLDGYVKELAETEPLPASQRIEVLKRVLSRGH